MFFESEKYSFKPTAYLSNSLSNINGECVTANKKLHLFEFTISGNNSFCQSILNDNSGSSKRTKKRFSSEER